MKIFRNSWDKWHLFGGMFLGIVLVLSILYPFVIQLILFNLFIILLVLLPWLWEKWDQYKVLYNDKRVQKWNSFAKALFTSEGKFDKIDMALTYIGFFVGALVISFLLKFFLGI